MQEVLILIPAAGAARRMAGADKLTQSVDGQPLLRRQAARALETGAPVLVTLPPDRPERSAALAGLNLAQVIVPEAAEGMSGSIRAGARAAMARAAAGLMVLPGDMPELTAGDLSAMLEAFTAKPAQPLRGTGEDGTPGHPVIFPAAHFAELAQVSGDEGGRAVLRAHPPRLLALPARHALTDLDTPEAWAAWRAARGS